MLLSSCSQLQCLAAPVFYSCFVFLIANCVLFGYLLLSIPGLFNILFSCFFFTNSTEKIIFTDNTYPSRWTHTCMTLSTTTLSCRSWRRITWVWATQQPSCTDSASPSSAQGRCSNYFFFVKAKMKNLITVNETNVSTNWHIFAVNWFRTFSLSVIIFLFFCKMFTLGTLQIKLLIYTVDEHF